MRFPILRASDKISFIAAHRAKQEKYISLALQTPKSAGLRGSGMGKHRLGRVYLGGVVVVGRHPRQGCLPLSRLCRKSARFKGAASSSASIFVLAQGGGIRQGEPASRPANTAPGRMGTKLTDGFLCRCPFERASKPNESLARDPQYIIVCVPVLDFAAVKIRLQRFYRFEGMRHGGKLERARQKG